MQSTGGHLSTFLDKQSKRTILAGSLFVTLVIGIFDYFVPYQISMSIFYTAPIFIAAWYADRRSSDLTAIVAVLIAWWTDELTAPQEALGWIHTYRMFVRLFFYLAISIGVSAVKSRRDMNTAQIDLLERSRRLEREIIKISEREQQRIGHDLHDGLCQYLAALTCAATSLKNDLQKQTLQYPLQEELRSAAEIAELLKQGVTQARNLARGLSPVHDDESGLDCALQELAATSSRMLNIDCEFIPGARFFVRDNAAAGHLYRIAQEALNNATRHGGATHIAFSVSERDGLTTLRITDNGKGLPGQPGRSGGMGLKIMDYRARLIGGVLQVANQPGGGGVTVTCTFRQQGAAAPGPAGALPAIASESRPGLKTALTA